jgi:hypothetical protein
LLNLSSRRGGDEDDELEVNGAGGGQERRLSDLESIIIAVASMCERKKMIVFLAWAPPVSDRTKMVRSLGSG